MLSLHPPLSLRGTHRSGKYHMNTKLCVSCTQPTIIRDDSVQKVDVFTNSRTTSQIGAYLNYITSGLEEAKKSYGWQCNVQNGMLQLNQCQTLYVFFMNVEIKCLFLTY